MRGYSFSELVKLAEAAMPRAGGVFAGDITAPQVYIANTQSAAANAATRFDWVNARLQERLNLAGGSMVGQLVGKFQGPAAGLGALGGSHAAYNVAPIELVPAASNGLAYAEVLHGSARVPEGYIQHLSMGIRRLSGTGWHDVYLATGGSDTSPTVEWLFGASGLLKAPGPVYLGGGVQDTSDSSAARVDWVRSQVGKYLPLSGGSVNGRVVVSADSNPLIIRPSTAGQACYLQAQSEAGINHWYIGRGDAAADVSWYNYQGGAGMALAANGAVTLQPTNGVVNALTRTLYMLGTGNKQLWMQSPTGADHLALWYEEATNTANLRAGGGQTLTLHANGLLVVPGVTQTKGLMSNQGSVDVIMDGPAIKIRPANTGVQPCYLQGTNNAGAPEWYLGKGDANLAVTLYNYNGGASLNLQPDGSVGLTASSLLTLEATNLIQRKDGAKQFQMQNANGAACTSIYYADSGITHISTGTGPALSVYASGLVVAPNAMQATQYITPDGGIDLRTPAPGGYVEWQSKAAALQVFTPDAINSAYTIWKATQAGRAHIAAMQVHMPSNNIPQIRLVIHGGASHVWDGVSYLCPGAIKTVGADGIYDRNQLVYSPHNVPYLAATHGYSDVIALSGTYNIGAYFFLQNHPNLQVGMIKPGETCDGSRLFPTSVDNDWDDIYGAPVPGVWRCQGYSNLGGPVGGGTETDWNAGKTLWMRYG